MPPADRAGHYRQKAREQIELAAGADTPEIRATCLELAAMWMRLAEAAGHRAPADAAADRAGAEDEKASA